MKELFHLQVDIHRKDSALLYHLLEASEGLCFYSTVKKFADNQYCRLHISGDPVFLSDVHRILQYSEFKDINIKPLTEEPSP